MERKSLWGAHLFIPGNKAGFLCKLPVLNVKNIIIDLEFATKFPFKTEARYLTRNAISYIRSVRPDINTCIRINLSSTGKLQQDDIEIVAKKQPDSIRVPSVNNADEIKFIDETLTKIERENQLEIGSIKLHPMIETPLGLTHISEIVEASPRIEAIAFGGEDWAQNCGLLRTKLGHELEHIKFEMVTAAAEHKIFAIDSVFSFLDDKEGLIHDCKNSRIIGFKARATINPRQLEIINRIYSPSQTEIKWAESIINNLTEIKLGNKINYISNGIIMDPLAINQARNIIKESEEVRINGIN